MPSLARYTTKVQELRVENEELKAQMGGQPKGKDKQEEDEEVTFEEKTLVYFSRLCIMRWNGFGVSG